ncbi:hypothetical protein KP509_02G106600 [Ceratopteris richardii]|uniref:Uncharacterized protein n=1 Tax=Ceratopteris richardii TaxID=49495 RepID=A0A8T2VGF0_CERRI|nr:hypothetical protein KP509_02G106600 [Ceratopteris richardii]
MVAGYLFLILFLSLSFTEGADPIENFQWNVSYITVAPLGVKQQVIAINGQFPGPNINSTTNNHIIINVLNSLDEDLLFTWDGIQQRRSSWEDGVLGTNCPIPPKWNWTYNFQVKDQIGSFFYFPSLSLQRSAGGYGGFTITNRATIAVPFLLPDGDITITIGDWYNAGHKALRAKLDKGLSLGMPDGVLINGKGPYPYNRTLVPKGILYETINVEPGKTYRIRVSNVGTSTSLNFRIQSHVLRLVETEGSYVSEQNFTTGLDMHVGQSSSFLVTMDQNASSDYYIVASARFVNETVWSRVTGVAILKYSNSKGPASGPLPPPPDDQYDPSWSMNQARSIRWNLTAGAARPNPQGSFHYGQINVTQSLLLRGSKVSVNGVTRYALNDVSFQNPSTPLKLADYYNLTGVFKLNAFPEKPADRTPSLLPSVISGDYRGFMEIVFQNDDDAVQSYHLDGYAFFVVGFDSGTWTEDDRGRYNKWDGVARCTTQVFPHSWTAVYVSLDNVGMWNLRSELLPNWYLGQEMYIRVYNPEVSNKTEFPIPDNAIYCGRLADKQKRMQLTCSGIL